MKQIIFLGSTLTDIRGFPHEARNTTGQQLSKVQYGRSPYDWKPMSGIGAGVKEIRVKAADGIYRTIYIAKFAEAVYVLHALQKKTQKTRKQDLDLARIRLKTIKPRSK